MSVLGEPGQRRAARMSADAPALRPFSPARVGTDTHEDPDAEPGPDTDADEVAPIGWLDRRRDLAAWLLTPFVTLIFAPPAAVVLGMFLLLPGDPNKSPAICKALLADNGCEETTLGMLGEHLALFGAAWLLLWLVPRWRGLLLPRVALALVVSAILIDVPIQMAG